jgi:hypothetical protein
MERRNFLRSMIGGVTLAAAVRTWPFRVYSFPSGGIAPAAEGASIPYNLLAIWKDGIPLKRGVDYVLSPGGMITFKNPPHPDENYSLYKFLKFHS